MIIRKLISNDEFYDLLDSFFNTSEKHKLYPTLILSTGYCGLNSFELIKALNNKKNTNDLLQHQLRVLGDPSKLKILLLIKDKPKYNLEIAEALSLFAATVSHHMNSLFNCCLVKFTKKNGRIYYEIETKSIEYFLENFKNLLL